MRRILILGARGTLGSQLVRLYPEAIAWDREDVDVLDFSAFSDRVRTLGGLEAIVNCTAFNDVDGAESKADAAFALNAAFPGRLAALCAELRIPVVHYSTNYVFSGEEGEYSETDPVNPVSVYGRSKAAGEEQVRAAWDRHYLIRTAVIFGPQGTSEVSKRSFVELMVDLAARRDTIQAVSDEINSVTYAPDLAAATAALLNGNAAFGTYHRTNDGAASWFDLAAAIFDLTERKPQLIAVPGSTFPRPAKRPARAILRNTKASALRPWQDALAEFVRSLPQAGAVPPG